MLPPQIMEKILKIIALCRKRGYGLTKEEMCCNFIKAQRNVLKMYNEVLSNEILKKPGVIIKEIKCDANDNDIVGIGGKEGCIIIDDPLKVEV